MVIKVLVSVALMVPDVVVAAPAADDLRARAEALEAEGRPGDAAPLWEQLADVAEDDVDRLAAYLDALDAYRAALAATGDGAFHDAARSVVRRAIDDPRIDARAREELAAELGRLEAEVAPRVDLLDPEGKPRVDRLPKVAPAPIVDSAPAPPSPRRIAGTALLTLAAPALGGTIYALARDRAIVRGYQRLGRERATNGVVDQGEVDRLDAEAPIVRGLAIGLGVASAALTAAGLALLLTSRPRSRAAASLSLSPEARPDLGGIVLSGRF